MPPYQHNADSEEEEEEEYTYEEVSEEEYEYVTASESEGEEEDAGPKTGKFKISKDRLRKNRAPRDDESEEENPDAGWMKKKKSGTFVDPREKREQSQKSGEANPWANVLKKKTPRGGEGDAQESKSGGGGGDGDANPWAGILKKKSDGGDAAAQPTREKEEEIPPWKREISKKKVGAVVDAVDEGGDAKPAARDPASPRPKPTTQKAPQQFNRPAPTTSSAPKQFNRPIAQGAKQVVPRQFNRPAGGGDSSAASRQVKSARGAAPPRGKYGAAAMPVKLSTAPAEQQIRELKAKYNAEKRVRINAVTKLENAVNQLNECRAALSRAEEIINEVVSIVKPGQPNATFISDIDRLLADVEALGEGIPIGDPEPQAAKAEEAKESKPKKKSSGGQSTGTKKKSSSSSHGKKKSSSSSHGKKKSSSGKKKSSSKK